jgi:hypothetical protein
VSAQLGHSHQAAIGRSVTLSEAQAVTALLALDGECLATCSERATALEGSRRGLGSVGSGIKIC